MNWIKVFMSKISSIFQNFIFSPRDLVWNDPEALCPAYACGLTVCTAFDPLTL